MDQNGFVGQSQVLNLHSICGLDLAGFVKVPRIDLRCFSSKKESLGPAVAGGLSAVGAPSALSGSRFGEASDLACLDVFSLLLIVKINYVALRTLVLLSYDLLSAVGARTDLDSSKTKIKFFAE
jgi:hypothetical protein